MVNFEARCCLPQRSKMQSLSRGKTSNIESWQEVFIKQKIRIIFEVRPPNPMLYKIHQPEGQNLSPTNFYRDRRFKRIVFQLPDDCLVHETPSSNKLILMKRSFIY